MQDSCYERKGYMRYVSLSGWVSRNLAQTLQQRSAKPRSNQPSWKIQRCSEKCQAWPVLLGGTKVGQGFAVVPVLSAPSHCQQRTFHTSVFTVTGDYRLKRMANRVRACSMWPIFASAQYLVSFRLRKSQSNVLFASAFATLNEE